MLSKKRMLKKLITLMVLVGMIGLPTITSLGFLNGVVAAPASASNLPDSSTMYPSQVLSEPAINPNPQIQAPETQPVTSPNIGTIGVNDTKTDRFIVKYKNTSQKGETIRKIRNKIKQRNQTQNQMYDVILTPQKMTQDDFLTLLRQNQADDNIAYIQPDYPIMISYGEATSSTTNSAISLDKVSPTTGLGITVGEVSPTTSSLLGTTGQQALSSTPSVLQRTGIAFDGQTITLSYENNLDSTSVPALTDFSILSEDGKDQTVSGMNITNEKLNIMLNVPVTDGGIILSYTPGTNPIRDLTGKQASGFSDIQVTPNRGTYPVNDPLFPSQWALFPNQLGVTTNSAISLNATGNLDMPVNVTTNSALAVNSTTSSAISVGIDAENAWNKAQGDGVVVAVLDTGIDITQEDLKDNIWTNPKEVAGNGADDDNNGYVDDLHGWNFVDNTNQVHNPAATSDEWHGTHTAGIIAAEMNNQKGIAGVAPKAKIMPLQVFKNGTANTSDIISAIEYAKRNGAQIVNCSWGTTSENQALKDAIAESGLLFICAAGNSNQDLDANPVYPASLTGDNIISVASIDQTGNLSGFSNYGQISVDVAAPGEDIASTLPGNQYGQSGGTSKSAAFVSGEAALILSKFPKATVSDIKSRILNSTVKLSSLTGKVASGGEIDCLAALKDTVTPSGIILQIPLEQDNDYVAGSQDFGYYTLFALDTWMAWGNIQTARMNFGTVALNDKIYCIGGSNNGDVLNSVEVFDPATQTSTTAGSLNTARYVLGVASVNGKLYAIGGYNGSFLNTVEEYDPATNIWTEKASMPTPRGFLGVTSLNGKIYAIGGLNNTGTLNTVEAYDPSTDTWTSRAGMPTDRSALGVVAVNNKIYAIGGSANWNYQNTVEEFDPASNTWTTKASMPTSKQIFGVTAINDELIVVGGYNNSSLQEVYEFSPGDNTWQRKADLRTPRSGLGAATVGNDIYALGGYNGNYLSSVEKYTLPFPPNALSVTLITSTSVTLAWPASQDATEYDIEVDGTVINNDLNTTYVHSNLQPQTTHTYRYRARSAGSMGDWSAPLTVTTAQGSAGTIVQNYVNAGGDFNLVISGNYLTSPVRSVTLTYNPGNVQLLDLCGFTAAADTMTSGLIPGTNMTVNQNTPGTIIFTVNLSIQNGMSWSGAVNVIKFKANVNNPSISYSL